MAKKIFWFDTETTGLDPKKQDIIQLAYMVEIDGKIIEDGQFFMQPFDYKAIQPDALQIHGLTVEKIKTFQPPQEAYKQIVAVLSKHIDKFNKADKFYPAGFCSRFDQDFLKAFFEKNNDVYYGSWFNYKSLDPIGILHYLDAVGKISLPNYKLATVCEHFGIKIKAHDAISDIKATRELAQKITDTFLIA